MRVLIIDDNTDLTTSLSASLKTAGFVVDTANDSTIGTQHACHNEYDAIILDYNLPRISGYEICQTIRARGKNIPILMLSALGSPDCKVKLLECGADDYVTKPFSTRELIARLHALGRRPANLHNSILQLGDLALDTAQHSAKRGKKILALTPKEFKILEQLLRSAGETVSRATLLEHVWDNNANAFSNSLDMHISTLRKKIDGSRKSSLISTIPGIGYKLNTTP